MRKLFLYFSISGNENPPKNSYIFSKESFCHVFGNNHPEKTLYISRNGTFLCFRRNFQSPQNQNLLYFFKKNYKRNFQKTILDNNFHLFYNLNQTMLLVYKKLKATFCVESFLSF